MGEFDDGLCLGLMDSSVAYLLQALQQVLGGRLLIHRDCIWVAGLLGPARLLLLLRGS